MYVIWATPRAALERCPQSRNLTLAYAYHLSCPESSILPLVSAYHLSFPESSIEKVPPEQQINIVNINIVRINIVVNTIMFIKFYP